MLQCSEKLLLLSVSISLKGIGALPLKGKVQTSTLPSLLTNRCVTASSVHVWICIASTRVFPLPVIYWEMLRVGLLVDGGLGRCHLFPLEFSQAWTHRSHGPWPAVLPKLQHMPHPWLMEWVLCVCVWSCWCQSCSLLSCFDWLSSVPTQHGCIRFGWVPLAVFPMQLPWRHGHSRFSKALHFATMGLGCH